MRTSRRAILLGALHLVVAMATIAPAIAQVPTGALQHRAELTRNARAVWGMSAPVAVFAAQIHQESAWRTGVASPVGALGLAQFMPATAEWISELYPELAANQPFNPSWAIRALVTYDQWLYARVSAANTCERWAFVLSSYNGGLGWVNRDKKLASSRQLDSLRWFGAVELVNAGRSAANWRENRDYPQRILYRHQPIYIKAGWTPGVCS